MPASLPSFARITASLASQARNLLNASELDAWVSEIRGKLGKREEGVTTERMERCGDWLVSVGRNWMLRHGVLQPWNPTKEELVAAPPWARKAALGGNPPSRLQLSSEEREKLAGILDWLRSEEGPALSSDWSRISVEQAEMAEKRWIERMAQAALKKDLEAADAAGTRLFVELGESVEGPGWRWVEVFSKEALEREGALMRHCVGSYAEEVEAGSKTIHSLRDAENRPLLTLESREGELAQLKAFANQACPEGLYPAVSAFCKAFRAECETRGWEASAGQEVARAGIVSLPGLGLVFKDEAIPAGWEDVLGDRMGQSSKHVQATVRALGALAAGGREDWGRVFERVARRHPQGGLEAAAEHGYGTLVRELIPVSDPKANDSYALRWAARNGHMEVVKLLMPVSDPGASESRALAWAAEKGHAKVVELLMPVSDPKAKDSRALAWAAESGHTEVVRLLIPVSDPKADNSAALRWAAQIGHVEVVRLLIPVSDPKVDDSWALAFAANNGHAEVVKLLIPVSNPKADDSCALFWAAKNGHVEVVKLLIPESDPKVIDLKKLEKKELTSPGHQACVELLAQAFESSVPKRLEFGVVAQKRMNQTGGIGATSRMKVHALF